ncbi:MAG: hypothetical protein MZV65_51920 [Chromatiales bacterium]|nr:hypothetical protein [Chromatiales bacterium]
MGDYEKARATVDSALSNPTVPTGYRAMAEMVKLTADSREILASPAPNRKALTDLDKQSYQTRSKHTLITSHSMCSAGNLRAGLGNYKDAIGPLERASRFEDGNDDGTYTGILRLPTLAKAGYKKALTYADKAYEMNKAVTSDEEFMYALAHAAYAATDNVDAAKDTLYR